MRRRIDDDHSGAQGLQALITQRSAKVHNSHALTRREGYIAKEVGQGEQYKSVS